MEKLNKFKKIINKFYYEIFIENFKNKISFDFPQDYFRWDLIDYLIKKNNYLNYLEIGCDDDQLFSKVKIVFFDFSSRLAVASSKSKISASDNKALTNAIFCICPEERLLLFIFLFRL